MVSKALDKTMNIARGTPPLSILDNNLFTTSREANSVEWPLINLNL